jgi:hypothetical protein
MAAKTKEQALTDLYTEEATKVVPGYNANREVLMKYIAELVERAFDAGYKAGRENLTDDKVN